MDIKDLSQKAKEIRDQYAKLELKIYGKSWTRGDIARGFVGDVGEAMKYMMAEDGLRTKPGSKEKLEHEMGDIIWAVLVLCDQYGIDPEKAFLETMEELKIRIEDKDNGK